MAISVYSDPSKRHIRPSLIGGITSVAATSKMVQAEDQWTEVLAWLIDRSRRFAAGVLELFLHGDEEALAAVQSAVVIGARTQVMLPSIGAGAIWPDLSVEGSDRAFQLLVEVKLGSEFHEY